MKCAYAWVLLLASVAWGQTTIYSGTVTTARIANPCELIGVGGRIYRLADYYQSMGMELCEKSLPMLTRPWDFLPLAEPPGPPLRGNYRIKGVVTMNPKWHLPIAQGGTGLTNGPTDGRNYVLGTSNKPIDVPAIQEPWLDAPKNPGEYPYCESTGSGMIGGMGYVRSKGPPLRWTCADKSRVLLTDEQGNRHCVKF